MSQLSVDSVIPQSGTTVTLGASGDTINIPSGVTMTNSGTASGFGKVLQVVQTYKTDTSSTTSTSFTDVSGLSANITPASTSNKILVLVTIAGAGQASVSQAWFRLNRNGSVVGVGDAAGNRKQISGSSIYNTDNNVSEGSTAFNYLDSPSTTSLLTYKIQFSADGGTIYVNRSFADADLIVRGRGTSSITLMEIAG